MTPPTEALLEALRSPGRVLLCSHEKPDGDALGSLCGLLALMRENGVDADAVLPDSPPAMYARLLPPGLLSGIDAASLNKGYARLVVLDVSARKRLSAGPSFKLEDVKIPVLSIDHHPDNELFGSVNWVDATASSTSELLLRLAEAMPWRLSRASATLIMMGVVSDTGCFKFDNTGPEVLRAAAKLMESGADFSRIVKDIYMTRPAGLAMLEADLLCNHLGLALGGRLAYFNLEPAILKAHSVELRDTENVVDVLRSLEGVEFAAILRPVEGGWKLSLRSKSPKLSAGRIARRLEGGGHEMAAGGMIRATSFEDAIGILIENVEREFNEAQARQA